MRRGRGLPEGEEDREFRCVLHCFALFCTVLHHVIAVNLIGSAPDTVAVGHEYMSGAAKSGGNATGCRAIPTAVHSPLSPYRVGAGSDLCPSRADRGRQLRYGWIRSGPRPGALSLCRSERSRGITWRRRVLGTTRKQWGSDVSAAPVVNAVSSMGGSGSRVIRGGGRSSGLPGPWP